ncbi:MAG: glycosyltransferase family A protein, partial [Nitrososphaerota archaeon]
MPRTLPFTLQSLLNQTIASDSELIFVTPDIEDPSYSIFKSFLDKLTDKYYAVKQIFDKGNGLAAARRIVVDYASSPYIVWVDGDQMAPPTF